MRNISIAVLAAFSVASLAQAASNVTASPGRSPASVEPASSAFESTSIGGATSSGSVTSWVSGEGGLTDQKLRDMFPNPTMAVSAYHIDPKTGRKIAKTDIAINEVLTPPCPCMYNRLQPGAERDRKELEYERLKGEYDAKKVLQGN